MDLNIVPCTKPVPRQDMFDVHDLFVCVLVTAHVHLRLFVCHHTYAYMCVHVRANYYMYIYDCMHVSGSSVGGDGARWECLEQLWGSHGSLTVAGAINLQVGRSVYLGPCRSAVSYTHIHTYIHS